MLWGAKASASQANENLTRVVIALLAIPGLSLLAGQGLQWALSCEENVKSYRTCVMGASDISFAVYGLQFVGGYAVIACTLVALFILVFRNDPD